MSNDKFYFELRDSETPEIVIRNAMEQINDATKGYVMGKIAAYSGNICSYTKTVHHDGLLGMQQSWDEEKVIDVQKSLGEQDENEYKFEVFLAVKGVPNYRYRLMFVRYNSISYPVTLVLNEDIAVAYDKRRMTLREVDSMNELQEMMDTIINSEYLTQLIQKLINESLRQEAKKQAEDQEA